MVFQNRLMLVKKKVERELAAFFDSKQIETKRISPYCTALVDQVRSLTMRGGKRTRPFLCWLGNQAVSRQSSVIRNELLSAMMGLELFQSFALIHDDIIDRDTIRRGGPTVHVQVGVPMAILAGDLALAWADELMKKCERKTENGKNEDIYQKMKEEVILGQSLDVLVKEGKPSADRATINRYKTAWYTVIRPLQIGAVVAGASQRSLASFVPYGLAVGEAYQLRDDYLDGAIDEAAFMKQRSVLLKRAAKAFNKPLFEEFAHFALSRQA